MALQRTILRRLGSGIRVILGLALILTGTLALVLLGWCRVYVPPGYCIVWISKAGAPMSAGQVVADPGQKGIQRETAGPGRYFYNPVQWEYERHKLVEIKAGNPSTWSWVHTVHRLPRSGGSNGNIIAGDFPEVGILTRKSGPPHPQGDTIVDMNSPYKGIIREVLTPGVYRINPYEYEVRKEHAVVIPAGFVGVVTSQIGEQPGLIEVEELTDAAAATQPPGPPPAPAPPAKSKIRPLAKPGQRGTLSDVFQPGVYFVNPNVMRVKITEVGYNEFSQLAGVASNETVRFPSKSGFDIELGVTVVWGLTPQHAAEVINEFGNTTEILEKVIKPQMRSICRNQGSLFEAREFIQGEKREEFQQVLTTTLRDVCRKKNIELLLALISTIEVHSREGGLSQASGAPAEADLRKEIQDSFLAIERQLTNVKLQETAKKKALLEEAKKKVDVRRETIQADTRKKVAELMAEGEKKAASVEAEGRLAVASIEQQIAELEAQKTQVLGQAQADVARLKQQAEADGKKLLVEALGSGEAYNLYTFARSFAPESIRMIYSGPGTFWTDLRKMEEIGAAQLLRQPGREAAPKPAP